MARLKIGYHRCFFQRCARRRARGERSCMGPERGLVQKKRRILNSRPARSLEGDGGSKGSGCAVCWDFPGVQWGEGAAALLRPSASATENHVAGGHIFAGLGCEGPSLG